MFFRLNTEGMAVEDGFSCDDLTGRKMTHECVCLCVCLQIEGDIFYLLSHQGLYIYLTPTFSSFVSAPRPAHPSLWKYQDGIKQGRILESN